MSDLSDPYRKHADQVILRDVLAIDRTRLANERTLLAWLRTALMFLVSGVTLIKLFQDVLLMELTGYALVPCAFVIGGLGLQRYLRIRKQIRISDKP
ncbi:MAG: DUF202 domain-containing protein [Gammaproteobacteria bacterium]|nr:DUF202 domain-containing protein [Gammaproteobacteria bacterium]MCP5137812.1 DUF202 domain-containing protein [Gammaproteobacteria bacterium]